MIVQPDGRPPATVDDGRIDDPPEIAEIDATQALEQFAAPQESEPDLRLLATAPTPARAPEPLPIPAAHRYGRRQRRGGRSSVKFAIGGLLVAAAAAAAFVTIPRLSLGVRPGAAAVDTGVLVLQSDPTGVGVSIDGHPRGSTPLEVSLAPGRHELTFGALETVQRIAVTVTPGSRTTHYVHLASGVIGRGAGTLQLAGAPPGARVSLDGVARGRGPLRLDNVAAGSHRLSVAYASGTVEQEVTVEPGRLTTILLPPRAVGTAGTAGTASAGGWLEIASPETVQVWERDQLVGSSQTARIMLPAGSHPIELVNEELGYRERRVITIAPGATNKLSVQMPQGSISVNAVPWAEVWIDGRHVGDTPLGDFAVAAGRHAVTLRHPQLGEKQQQAIVRVGASTAISADLRR
jgi:hypothetical protein